MAKVELLCPRCLAKGIRSVLQPEQGLSGFWQCPNYDSHQFTEDAELDKIQEYRAAGVKHLPQEETRRCPECRQLMKLDERGWFCDGPAHGAEIFRPEGEAEKPQPYWLAHIGINQPLPPVPQSNIKDGSYCLKLGSIKHAGGTKGGRKRKKPEKKGPPDYFL